MSLNSFNKLDSTCIIGSKIIKYCCSFIKNYIIISKRPFTGRIDYLATLDISVSEVDINTHVGSLVSMFRQETFKRGYAVINSLVEWPHPIYMSVCYVLESRFSAGMI